MMMTGRIGGKVIVNEDINKFFDQIKDLDWTDNNIYKPAKICSVKPTFSVGEKNSQQGHFQSKLGFFEQYLIEDNSNHLNDFKTYKNDVESKHSRVNDRILSQKNEFMQMINLDGVDDSAKQSQILEGIKNNLAQIVNNSSLKNKIGSLVNAMENQNQNQNPNQNANANVNPNVPNQGNNNNMNNNFGNNQQNQFNNNNNFNNQMGGFNNNNNGFNNNFGNNQQNNNQNQNQNWGNHTNNNPNNFNFK